MQVSNDQDGQAQRYDHGNDVGYPERLVSGDYTKTMYVVRVHIHNERYHKIVTVVKEEDGMNA